MSCTSSTVTYSNTTTTILTCPCSLLIGYFSPSTVPLISQYIHANSSLPVLSSLKIFYFHMYHHTHHLSTSHSHSHLVSLEFYLPLHPSNLCHFGWNNFMSLTPFPLNWFNIHHELHQVSSVSLLWYILGKDVRVILLWLNKYYFHHSIHNIFPNEMISNINMFCSHTLLGIVPHENYSNIITMNFHRSLNLKVQKLQNHLNEHYVSADFWYCYIFCFGWWQCNMLLSSQFP